MVSNVATNASNRYIEGYRKKREVNNGIDSYGEKKIMQNDTDIDFDKLFDSVLKNKTDTTLTANDLIKKYGLSSKLNDAINSIKVVGKNKVYVDWKNETKINFFTKLSIQDGNLTLKKNFIQTSKNPNLGISGYIITGSGLKVKNSNPVFVHNNAIYPYYYKTNSIGDGAKL